MLSTRDDISESATTSQVRKDTSETDEHQPITLVSRSNQAEEQTRKRTPFVTGILQTILLEL